jgi:Ca2+-binding RTX toxin-like protein
MAANAHADFTGTVSGGAAVFAGGAGPDHIRLASEGGLLRNDLRARGDLRYSSDSDFDSNLPGDQPVPDNDGSVVVVLGAAGDDSLAVQALQATVRLYGQDGNDDFALADGIATPVVVDGGSGDNALDYGPRTTPVSSGPGANAVFAAALSGAQAVPPAPASTATGGALAILAPDGQLMADLSAAGLGSAANGGHIHGPAAPGTTGPVVFDLQPPGVTAFDTIAWPLTPSATQIAALQSGLWYADVHTQGTGTGGELRGQFSAAGTDRVATGVARATQVANVTGGLDTDSLTGDEGPNTLRGGPGEDSIAGGAGDDVIDGGSGADTLSGDAGDDVILSRDSASDHVACGPGTDSVVADPQDVIAADCEIAGIRASDRTRPSLTQVRLSRTTFRLATATTPTVARTAAVSRGTVLRYQLSERATVTIDVLPRTTTSFLGRLTRRSHVGRNAVRFSGRIKGRTLKPGSYRLRVSATDAAGNRSAARTVRFKVVPR